MYFKPASLLHVDCIQIKTLFFNVFSVHVKACTFARGPRFKSQWIQQEKFVSPFSCGWLGHNINVECSARLETSLGLNPVIEVSYKFTYFMCSGKYLGPSDNFGKLRIGPSKIFKFLEFYF